MEAKSGKLLKNAESRHNRQITFSFCEIVGQALTNGISMKVGFQTLLCVSAKTTQSWRCVIDQTNRFGLATEFLREWIDT